MGKRFAVFVIAAVLLTACADSVTQPGANPEEVLPHLLPGHYVARAVAVAMGNEDVQESVREAMRRSDLVEHKVDFHEFIASDAGVRLIQAASTTLGEDPNQLDALMLGLHAADFYVPVREQRLEWRTGDAFVVGYAPDEDDSVIQAFRPDGRPMTWGQDARTMEITLFLIHPAEPKGRRVHPQPATPGAAIQDPADGELSFVHAVETVNGEVVTIDLADLPYAFRTPRPTKAEFILPPIFPLSGSSPELSTGGAGSFLTMVNPTFSDGVGGCEIYVHMSIYDGYNGHVRLETDRWPNSGSFGGLPCDDYGTYYWDFYNLYPYYGVRMLDQHIGHSGEYIKCQIYEDDQWDDDDMGKFTFYDDAEPMANGNMTMWITSF